MADATYIHHVTVRFSDTDALGHVNNARFLSYIEDARIAFLSALTESPGTERFREMGYIVARIEIDFITPLVLDAEPVAVSVGVAKVGTKSFRLDHTITQRGTLAARAGSVLVAYDYSAGCSRALGDRERLELERYLAPAARP